jgi:hypothetical protein
MSSNLRCAGGQGVVRTMRVLKTAQLDRSQIQSRQLSPLPGSQTPGHGEDVEGSAGH